MADHVLAKRCADSTVRSRHIHVSRVEEQRPALLIESDLRACGEQTWQFVCPHSSSASRPPRLVSRRSVGTRHCEKSPQMPSNLQRHGSGNRRPPIVVMPIARNLAQLSPQTSMSPGRNKQALSYVCLWVETLWPAQQLCGPFFLPHEPAQLRLLLHTNGGGTGRPLIGRNSALPNRMPASKPPATRSTALSSSDMSIANSR